MTPWIHTAVMTHKCPGPDDLEDPDDDEEDDEFRPDYSVPFDDGDEDDD